MAAEIVSSHVKEPVHCIAIQYSDEIQEPSYYTDKIVYIVDFSFPIEKMKIIVENAQEVIWLDHHDTAMKMYSNHKPFFTGARNMKTVLDGRFSGAGLAWDYFNPRSPMPTMVAHIQDRDLYHFKIANTEFFHTYLESRPFTIDSIRETRQQVEDGNYDHLIAIGKALWDAKQNQMKWAMQFAHPIFINGKEYTAVNGHRSTISELGEIIAKKGPVNVGVVYFMEGLRVKISLRSEKGSKQVNVREIAESFPGGGGHDTAASFYTTIEEFNKMLYKPVTLTFAKRVLLRVGQWLVSLAK